MKMVNCFLVVVALVASSMVASAGTSGGIPTFQVGGTTSSLSWGLSSAPTPGGLDVTVTFDPATWTVTYIVYEKEGSACAIIDSVLDYDPKSGRTRTDSADRVIDFVHAKGLTVDWILDTHAHADHL